MNTSPAGYPDIDELISFVRGSRESDFYRNIWKSATAFEDLPHMSRADLAAVPLSSRRYKHEKGMVKIVGGAEGAFLSEWSFADIGAESYATRSARPMVYLSDTYEATEKTMWCYENNMTPLIAEKDPELAIYEAGRYKIDSLIADQETVVRLTPFFSNLSRPLASITIIGSSFVPEALMHLERYAQSIRLVLALPETGIIAHAPLSPSVSFVPLDDCVIEREDEIVLTKKRRYPTPIIRYRTGISSKQLG